MALNLQETTLENLFQYYHSHPGSPKMVFVELCEELFKEPSQIDLASLQAELLILQKKGWVNYDLTESGSAGLIWIEPDGIKVAQSIEKTKLYSKSPSLRRQGEGGQKDEIRVKKTKPTSKSPTESCPPTFGDLIQGDPDCARLVQREDLRHEIIKYLTKTPDPKANHIVLHGQPMVGKTQFLGSLSRALEGKFVPLMVTAQGLVNLDNLDHFVFDLADQLTNKLRKWARKNSKTINLKTPDWEDFTAGKSTRAFKLFWEKIEEIIENKQPVVIFDEIEHLLDYYKTLEPRIFTFLDDFIRSPENGYFILAGSEHILQSDNDKFSMLIGKGRALRVPCFNKQTTMAILSKVQDYVICEDNTLNCFATLCDGHPRILQNTYEVIASYVNKLPLNKKISKSDIGPIVSQIIERTGEFLWALLHRLTEEERTVVWLISRNISLNVVHSEHSIDDLFHTANKHIEGSRVEPERIRKGLSHLESREWLEWKNKSIDSFHFKLGIFPLWLNQYHISVN